jgi:hypothetical protein
MKKVGILAFLTILVIACGFISTGMLSDPLGGLLITQSGDPYASPFVATPQQAMQIVVWGGFVIFNVIGLAATLALVFWFINRSLVKSAGSTPPAPAGKDAEAASE